MSQLKLEGKFILKKAEKNLWCINDFGLSDHTQAG